MGQLFSGFVLIVIGAMIVLVVWWYIATLRDWLFPDRRTYALGEVEVVGKPEEVETYKKVLPRIIVARLAKVRNEVNEAILSLKEARHRSAGELRPQSQEYVTPNDLPQPFSQPVDVNLTIADVDFGPLLAFLTAATATKNTLEITATISPDGGTAHVYGYLPGSSGYSFSESTDVTPDTMADTVATSIVAEVLKKGDPALAALGASEYGKVVGVLSEYAGQLRLAPIRGEPTRSELKPLNDRLREIAPRFSRWRDLQRLAAEIAEKAGAWEDANVYYNHLLEMTPETHPDRALVRQKVEYSQAEQEKVEVAGRRAEESGESTQQILEEQNRKYRVAASMTVEHDVAAPVLQLIGMTAANNASGQKIGVVGLPWREALDGIDAEFVGTGDGGNPTDLYADYVTEVIQTVRIVAENPTFVFAPLGGTFTTADLLKSLNALARHPDVDVILLVFASQMKSEIMNDVLRALSRDHAVVLAAGNQPPGQSVYADIADSAFVAGAVDRNGKAAQFTATGDNLLWAPGVDIPVISPSNGALVLRSGTAFSGAIMAGVVAVLKSRFPEATPEVLRSVLQETAKPASGGKSSPVINLPAAIEALERTPDQRQAQRSVRE